MVVSRHGMSPPEWLDSLDFLSPRVLLPHVTWVAGSRGIDRPGRDLEIIAASGATVVHCPLVSARGGRALDSFARYRGAGIAHRHRDRHLAARRCSEFADWPDA
jgi:cytosine/adenosine deaminase-related metal-dependent hydrolase